MKVAEKKNVFQKFTTIDRVRCGNMRQSSASLLTLSAGTPGTSVCPSPRQMPCQFPSSWDTDQHAVTTRHELRRGDMHSTVCPSSYVVYLIMLLVILKLLNYMVWRKKKMLFKHFVLGDLFTSRYGIPSSILKVPQSPGLKFTADSAPWHLLGCELVPQGSYVNSLL